MQTHERRGFSLIEILVAVAVFSVVMVITAGSLLTMLDANRKAQALKSVMNNLNFAVESMVRNIRVGTTYHCRDSTNPPPNIDTTRDCVNGGVLFGFEASNGSRSDVTDQVVYRFIENRLERSTDSGANFTAVTAPEVIIDELTFYVVGSSPNDNLQPKVIIAIRGHAGVSDRTRTDFELQATASQRVFDIPF